MKSFTGSSFRKLFLLVFPAVLLILVFFVFNAIATVFYEKQAKDRNQRWLSRAEFTASRICSEYSIPLQLKKASFRLGNFLMNQDWTASDSKGPELSSAIKVFFDKEVLRNSQIWGFSSNGTNFSSLMADGLEKNRRRIMEKALQSLTFLAKSEELPDHKSIKKHKKNLNNVFGANCSATALSLFREGLPTPVEFSGRPAYILWKRFFNNKAAEAGGIIAILPVKIMENHDKGLQILADRSLGENGNKLAVAFLLSKKIFGETKILLPKAFDDNPSERNAIKKELENFSRLDRLPMRTPTNIGNYCYYFDNININSPFYLAIVSKSLQVTEFSLEKRFLPLIIVFLIAWFLYYFKRVSGKKGKGISLELSFRMIFFMTGMVPVFFTVYLMAMQILKSTEVQIQEKKSSGFAKLQEANDRSEALVQVAQEIFNAEIGKFELQELLISNSESNWKNAFEHFKKAFLARKLFLSQLFLMWPGRESRFYVSQTDEKERAKTQLGYYANSCSSLNEIIKVPQKIVLNHDQIALSKSFESGEELYDEDIFLESLERVTSFQAGPSRKQLFTSSFISRGLPAAYITLAINFNLSLKELILDQFAGMNKNSSNTFIAISRQDPQKFKTIPQLPQSYLNSRSGQLFKLFLESTANSLFQISLESGNHIYLYEPLLKTRTYYGGASIDVSDIYAEQNFQWALLLAAMTLLSMSIYMLSSAISSIMITPLKNLGETFNSLSDGDFSASFKYAYNNELGMLANSTNKMVKGLRERATLGKFVSTTFDSEVSKISSNSTGQKMNGCVLFSDIRNFTSISEANSPEIVADALNEHLSEMVEVIDGYGGKVEQFIGDAIVAFFPVNSESQKMVAVNAAVSMMKRHQEISLTAKRKNKLSYSIGIGVAYGEVMSGILKSSNRSEFTIIGATRTRAEFLEAGSKLGIGTKIMISDEMLLSCKSAGIAVVKIENSLYEIDSGADEKNV